MNIQELTLNKIESSIIQITSDDTETLPFPSSKLEKFGRDYITELLMFCKRYDYSLWYSLNQDGSEGYALATSEYNGFQRFFATAHNLLDLFGMACSIAILKEHEKGCIAGCIHY